LGGKTGMLNPTFSFLPYKSTFQDCTSVYLRLGTGMVGLARRCLAMTEIRCRRTGTLFRYSFCDWRFGQLTISGRFLNLPRRLVLLA
jgi:hypothetical protein